VLTRLKRLPSPALIVASIALVLAAAGGIGYAASKINGQNIKKHSIPGNRLKKNTVTGKQTKESSLGKVPKSANATGLAGPLASGQTLRGYVNVTGHTDPGDITDEASISFPIPLATAPTVHFIPVGGPSTGACPGTAANPSATGGNLCIYELTIVGATGMALPDGLNPVTVTRFGVPGVLATGSATDYITRAAWAVKAP